MNVTGAGPRPRLDHPPPTRGAGLTGPESLRGAEMVAILSEAVGRPIEHVAMSQELARENMLKAGVPPRMVDAALQGITFRPGEDQPVLPTVEQVLGRDALTWAEWTRENAAAFT